MKMNKRVLFYRASTGIFETETAESIVPPDMLRYDMAFIRVADPTLIAFPSWRSGYGGRVTHGRWKSFSITLEEAKLSRPDLFELRETLYGDKWVTYRRVPHPGGLGDLVLVPISKFLAIKPRDFPSGLVPEPERGRIYPLS